MVMWPAMLVGQTPIPSQIMTSTSFWNIRLRKMPSTSFLEMLLAGAAFSIGLSGSLTISLGFVYSKEKNGGFCLPCVFFATSGYRGQDPGVLVSRPLTNFKKALEQRDGHRKKEYHSTAITRANEFQRIQEEKKLDLSVDTSAAIDVFARHHPRRLEVVNILEDEEYQRRSQIRFGLLKKNDWLSHIVGLEKS